MSLQKNLGFYQGLALYLAAVLGTGILIVPLIAWHEGGPASLIAWIILAVLGFALAWTFAAAGSQIPDAGGIQSMIGRIWGPVPETLSKYLILFSVPAGSVPGAFIFAQHLCAAFLIPESYVSLLALASWLSVGAANYWGIRISANAQLILSGMLVALLAFFIFTAFSKVTLERFHPFLPHGLRGIGNAALLIFWSFMGWEAIAHLAEEFHNPKRDMTRAAITAALIVGVFYFAISFVLIGVGIFNDNPAQAAPLVLMASNTFGAPGRIFTGVLAAIICLGTMNVYMAGLSRLCYSMARAGDLPKFLAKLDSAGTPGNSVLFLMLLNCGALAIQFHYHFPLALFFRLQNVAFLLLYIFGCIAAARLLKSDRLAAFSAYFSSAVCVLILLFARGSLFYPGFITIVAFIILYFKRRKQRSIS
jgi:amino acid efflux transporter